MALKPLKPLARLQESLQRIEGMQESTSEQLRVQQENLQEGVVSVIRVCVYLILFNFAYFLMMKEVLVPERDF